MPKRNSIRSAAMPDAGRKGLYSAVPSQREVDEVARKLKKSFRKLEREERGKRRNEYRPARFRRLTSKQRQRRRQEHLTSEKMGLFDRFFEAALTGLCQGAPVYATNAYGIANAASLVAQRALEVREKARARVAALKVTLPNWD